MQDARGVGRVERAADRDQDPHGLGDRQRTVLEALDEALARRALHRDPDPVAVAAAGQRARHRRVLDRSRRARRLEQGRGPGVVRLLDHLERDLVTIVLGAIDGPVGAGADLAEDLVPRDRAGRPGHGIKLKEPGASGPVVDLTARSDRAQVCGIRWKR